MTDPEKAPEQQKGNTPEKQCCPWQLAAAWTKQKYETYKTHSGSYAKEYSKRPWWFQQTDPVAKFTGWVAIYTLALAIVASLQTCVLNNQLEEARVDQRPWISFSAIPVTNLTYERGAAHLALQTIVKNVGHLPAQYVYVKAYMIPWTE